MNITAERLAECERMARVIHTDMPTMIELAEQWLPSPLPVQNYDAGPRGGGISNPTLLKATSDRKDAVHEQWRAFMQLLTEAHGHLSASLHDFGIWVNKVDDTTIDGIITRTVLLQAVWQGRRCRGVRSTFDALYDADVIRLAWLNAKANASPTARGFHPCRNSGAEHGCPSGNYAEPGRRGNCGTCAEYARTHDGRPRPDGFKRSA